MDAFKRFVLVATCLGLAGTASAQDETRSITLDRADLQTRDVPLVVGVGVHFGIGGDFNYVADKTAASLHELGVDSYRDDLAWPAFDQPGSAPGAYQPAQLFDFMKIAGLQPLLILGHGNEAIKDGNPPLSDASRRAFADFAARAAKATAQFHPMYEIWNEWNVQGGFNPPWLIGAGNASDKRAAMHYSEVAKLAVPAVRQAAPGSSVLSGAVGEDKDWQWTRAIIDQGALKDASALSVHLYNHCDPDVSKRTATDMIDRLSLLAKTLSKESKGARIAGQKPIYVTEFGWPTALQPCVISQDTAADNIAQFLLWSAATPWVKGAWVYQLKDQGRDPKEMEFNFGLYDYDYRPKPAACAVREVTSLIKAARAFQLERPFPDVFLLHVDGGSGRKLVTWTTGEASKSRASLSASQGGPARALCGATIDMSDGAFEIGPRPLIIDLPASEPIIVKVTAGRQ
jgi:hypothetical protein